jgi:hypothetical protein
MFLPDACLALLERAKSTAWQKVLLITLIRSSGQLNQIYLIGSRSFGEDHFLLLSHAIMSRASRLTASGVDPNVGRLARCIVGLGRLQRVTKTSVEGAGLGRVLDVVLAILRERDPLRGGYIIPLSLWDRVKGYLTLRKPKRLRRQMNQVSETPDYFLSNDLNETPDWLVSPRYHPWMIWLFDALRQFSVEEICLLADTLSDQLALYLRALTITSRRSSFRTDSEPNEPLYSAFCLAYVLFQRVPQEASKLKLLWIIASAGVRLQLSDLPPRARLTSLTDSDQSGHEQAAGFVEWADISLQEHINLLIWDNLHMARVPAIYSNLIMHPRQITYAEEGKHLFRLCTW